MRACCHTLQPTRIKRKRRVDKLTIWIGRIGPKISSCISLESSGTSFRNVGAMYLGGDDRGISDKHLLPRLRCKSLDAIELVNLHKPFQFGRRFGPPVKYPAIKFLTSSINPHFTEMLTTPLVWNANRSQSYKRTSVPHLVASFRSPPYTMHFLFCGASSWSTSRCHCRALMMRAKSADFSGLPT